jgi:YggT family protein
VITSIILQLLDFFKLALYARMFAKNWRPNSFLLAIFEIIYSITDPPMKYVQRFVPPLRLGGIALDLSFIVLLIAVNLLQGVIRALL